MQHPGQLDVVDVAALAADEARVLLARQAAEADRALRRQPVAQAVLAARVAACDSSVTATLTVRQRPHFTRTFLVMYSRSIPAASTLPHSTQT